MASKKDVDFDGIIASLGKFGPYQIKHYFWTAIIVILASTHTTNYIFIGADVNYRCQVDACDTNFGEEFELQWLSNAIPHNEKCLMHPQKPGQNFSCLSEDSFDRNATVLCEKYVFQKEDTFIEEFSIACSNWKRTLLGSLRGISSLIAYPIVGYCSDRWGRKTVIIVTGILDGVFGVIKALSVSYTMYAIFEFVETIFGNGLYSTAYVLALELLIPKTRVIGSSSTSCIFATGQIVLGCMAWLIPYWRTFLLTIYTPSIIIFFYYWLLDESPRWLLSKHYYKRAMAGIVKIARTNKKQPTVSLIEPLEEKIKHEDQHNSEKTEQQEEPVRYSMKEIFKSRILTLRLINCSVWWFCCIFCIYGLSINSVSLSSNKYIGFLLSAVVEIPGHISGYLGMTYFGRKRTIMTGFLITGVCLLSFGFLPGNLAWLSMSLYLIGKFSIVMAIGGIYLYTSELFPTPLRLSTFTICSMFGRFGTILAPQTPLLLVYSKAIPPILFSVAALISAISLIWSPETLGKRLPETIEEAEHIEDLKVPELTRL